MPALAATIERRLLVNYRVDPVIAQTMLPPTLRPQLIDGSAVAGICLLRLGALRPSWFTPEVGWRAENVAHRIAVEWDDATGLHNGVYVPQRHSASWAAVAAGERVFPGVHTHAHFTVAESDARIRVAMTSHDTSVSADIELGLPWQSSLFETVDDASAFFRNGSTGWSPPRNGTALQGIMLSTTRWAVEAGRIRSVSSSFFDTLPPGSATLDSVLVMRDVPVIWSMPSAPAPQRVAAYTRA